MKREPLIEYIISHKPTLLKTDFAREIWMNPERLIASHRDTDNEFTIKTISDLYSGKLFVYDNKYYGVSSWQRIDNRESDEATYRVQAEDTHIPYNPNETRPLCTPQDTFDLYPGDIANYKDSDPLPTTIGRFIANYWFLVWPFDDIVPYINKEFKASNLERILDNHILNNTISIRQVKDRYINAMTLFGQSNDIFCPNISEKTITIPKEIHELRERLVSENREALEHGDTTVMSMIEKTLISRYREYLHGDPSLHFLLKKKYFDVTLKKLFLTQGMTEKFGSPGKFSFIEQPMGSGWKQKDLPDIFNEVRQGSYARAVETANGGVIAKLILRVFQDTNIGVDDCKTTRGEYIHGDKNELKDFIGNYVIESDGTNTLITDENVSEYVDRDVIIRTPGYCQANPGYCAKCFGKMFETLGQKAFGPVANSMASRFTTNSLKSMHGKSHNVNVISSINKYLI
jgi:hypothetical protein